MANSALSQGRRRLESRRYISVCCRTGNSSPWSCRCTGEKKCSDIWREALAAINFENVIAVTVTEANRFSGAAEVGTKFGWKWLAEVTGRITGTFGQDYSETVAREKILADPSPDLLIPVLNRTNFVLVIEDFHYLDDDEKMLLFQQWKRFIDNDITILVLGTTHRAIDIASSNKDLIGRIAQIDIAQWDEGDLAKICDLGFKYLGVKLDADAKRKICVEAVGLPIIVQQVCLQILLSKGIETDSHIANRDSHSIKVSDVTNAFTVVANRKYSQFGVYYTTLIRGPKEKNRKYKTYELILACFNMDPITFSLTRSEVNNRLAKMKIAPEEKPPAASLNSTFGALKKFQGRRNFELLEWMPNEESLYIVEPSFLFYVRWRINREKNLGVQLDLFEALLETVRAVGRNFSGIA